MKKIEDFVDGYSLITVRGGDGGDTHANQFTALYCMTQIDPELSAWRTFPLLQGPNAIPIRHPDPEKWYHYEDRCSRDQFLPLLYFVSSNHTEASNRRFKEIFWLHAKRGFLFAWNTKRNFQYPTLEEHLLKSTPDVKWDYKSKMPDITGPEVWATWIRGLMNKTKMKPLLQVMMAPVLSILDLENLVGSIIKRYKWTYKKAQGTGRDGIDHDDRNHALGTHFAYNNSPTPISLLSKLIYGKERPLFCFKSFWEDQSWEPPMNQLMDQLYC